MRASETNDGVRFNEGMAKEMTGNEKTVSAKFMGRDLFEFRQTAKLWLMTNHLPNIRGVDDGIWRRVRLVPFNRKFRTLRRTPGWASG